MGGEFSDLCFPNTDPTGWRRFFGIAGVESLFGFRWLKPPLGTNWTRKIAWQEFWRKKHSVRKNWEETRHVVKVFHNTVDGRNLAPVDMVNIPLFTRFHSSVFHTFTPWPFCDDEQLPFCRRFHQAPPAMSPPRCTCGAQTWETGENWACCKQQKTA